VYCRHLLRDVCCRRSDVPLQYYHAHQGKFHMTSSLPPTNIVISPRASRRLSRRVLYYIRRTRCNTLHSYIRHCKELPTQSFPVPTNDLEFDKCHCHLNAMPPTLRTSAPGRKSGLVADGDSSRLTRFSGSVASWISNWTRWSVSSLLLVDWGKLSLLD
jgi:hypothetical protein